MTVEVPPPLLFSRPRPAVGGHQRPVKAGEGRGRPGEGQVKAVEGRRKPSKGHLKAFFRLLGPFVAFLFGGLEKSVYLC